MPGETCYNTLAYGNRYLAHDTGWGPGSVEANYFCYDHGHPAGGRVVENLGDPSYVYSYNAGPPPHIYHGHRAPNIPVQREVACTP